MRSARALIVSSLLALACALLATGCGAARAGHPLAVGQAAALPASIRSHVVVVVMENAEYGEVIGNSAAPYINSLAARYGLATAGHAVAHPSLPNYLALTSGTTAGIESDCTSCAVSARNIVDSLQAAAVSWKAYMEDIPRPCFTGAGSGGYAKKHDPFVYYRDVVADPSRCGRVVGFGALAADLRAGALPTFAWVSPNLCDDGHDCALHTADSFLASTLPALLRELGPHGLLILTWDEGTSDTGCCGGAHGGHVATIVAGPDVRPHAREHRPMSSYGVLATVERALRLPLLGASGDPRAGGLEGLFARTPRLR